MRAARQHPLPQLLEVVRSVDRSGEPHGTLAARRSSDQGLPLPPDTVRLAPESGLSDGCGCIDCDGGCGCGGGCGSGTKRRTGGAVGGLADTEMAGGLPSSVDLPSALDQGLLDWEPSLVVNAKIGTPPNEPDTGGNPGDPPPTYYSPDDDAQADATNEIIEALADGEYEGELGQFWEDLESIQEWDQAQWRESNCELFDPPNSGDCPLAADISACPTPCVDAQPDGCDLSLLPFEQAEGLYDFLYEAPSDGVYNDEAVDMVQYAWAFLLDNLDLVEWAACLFYGESASPQGQTPWEWLSGLFGQASVAECIVNKFLGRNPDVTIRFADDDIYEFTSNANSWTGGTINIPIEGIMKKYIRRFVKAGEGTAQQFCIIADLAATLLHEMVHICTPSDDRDQPGRRRDGTPKDAEDLCSTAILIENSFRWALWRRYPCLEDTNCSFYEFDCVWRSDNVSYPWLAPCTP